ncbi:LD-carboxypeptidase [Umezawaea sp. Da 62-37]|uniref:S66 family peptidase n=1 Tax=Umezawaea sp. Da 62-37 TaxID=3075927 RepID=UPI0028F6EDAE|nr:LD-carboxypeptidase [Umezawaea sp. Da 62-37]WNV85788.1 LD-carboxypeptidase [Umezawaea sp. Da 62-37]
MAVTFPAPLLPGDLIGITSPSSGVREDMTGRLDRAIRTVESHGYEVAVGTCMDGSGHVSAPAAERAAELMAMLTDPAVRAVVPPWGGETAIDLLPLLDWDALRRAVPTWMVGFSDIATIITPLTLVAGIATVHGNNLMDTPYRTPEGLLSWLDVVAAPAGSTLVQTPPGRYRAAAFDDYRHHPDVDRLDLDTPGRWQRLDGEGDVDVMGRLVGGCVETLCNLTGTPFGDVAGFRRASAPEGLIVYVEAAESDAAAICRHLHGMRMAGFFDGANAVLVGRTRAPAWGALTQHAAVLDALGGLGVPIIADVECGHVMPYLPLVNGALGRVVHTADHDRLEQTLA